MRTVLKRLPLLAAAGAAGAILLLVSISDHPELPVIDGWISGGDKRIVAKGLFMLAVFFLTLLLATVVQRYVESGLPNRLKGGVFELDWTPEEAGELRAINERLQSDQRETAALLQDTIKRIGELENAGPQPDKLLP